MIKRFGDGRDWFFEKRLGMFVHWGLYAIPAWHEQILWRGKTPRHEYEPLIHQFNPTNFDPDRWIDRMEEAGMEFVVLTTKHHDGFCLWDTKYTEYNIMNTPYGKDIVGMLADACNRRGVLFGIYYSIPDWHHPNYPNLGRHHEMFGPRAGDEPDERRYLEYVVNQMTELCTNYGELCQIFWDVNVLEWHDASINELVRSLQPSALINDRGPDSGDFGTPERRVPEGKAFSRLTQACQSLGRESWGYKTDEDYYSHKFLMQSVDKILAMGGSYLLNVGPRPDGTFAEPDIAALRSLGAWYHRVKESFVDTVPASYLVDENGRDSVLVTRRGNSLYIHVNPDPQTNGVVLRPLDVTPARAVLLNTGQEVETSVDMLPFYWREKPYLRIRNLPVNEMNDQVMVVRLDFNESINA